VLHVGHRPGLEHFHTREMNLARTGSGAAEAQQKDYTAAQEFAWSVMNWLKR